MKILFYTPHNVNIDYGLKADYMSDLLFHGLRESLGSNCVDFPKKHHMYREYPHSNKLWGRGFTYSETLDDIEVDREDIAQKLKTGYFDLLVFSIHHSIQLNYSLVESLLEDVKTDTKMAIIDGHDWPSYNSNYFKYTNLFFKREIEDNADERLIPIWFCIPESKINFTYDKKKDFAFINPGSNESHWPKDSRSTHIYTVEEDYYKDYEEARFAFTCKKGGWDCMRHPEIIANGCVPIFTDIENCPKKTLFGYDKELLKDVKKLPGLKLASVDNSSCFSGDKLLQHQSTLTNDFKESSYQDLQAHFEYILREKLTTKKLASYFLTECK